LERQGLRTVMEKYALEIEDFKERKIMDFETEFDKHDDAKRIYLLQEKEALREKREEKRDMLKKSMKDSMREEILQELAAEKELQMRQELLTKYSTIIPNITDNVTIEQTKEQFVKIARDIADNRLILEPDQKLKLQSLAIQTTQIALALQLINSELQNFTNSSN